MKKLVFAFAALTLLIAAGALWLGAPAGASIETATETPVAQPAPQSTAPEACEPANPLALPEAQQACCIDQCSRDRDCRFICGKEFGGQCVQVNSCCRQCACLGFAPSPGLPS